MILIFVLVFGTIITASANSCNKESLQILEKCYRKLFLSQLNFSYPYLAPYFVQELKQDWITADGVIKRCKREATFQDCLRNKTIMDVITDCVNFESYLGLTFVGNVSIWARQYVTSFFEIDYVCKNGYKTMVYFNDCINNIPVLCKNYNNSSGCQNDYFKCMKENTEEQCGAAAGCSAYKDATISVCYEYDIESTSTIPSTTTIEDNSTINIVVVTRSKTYSTLLLTHTTSSTPRPSNIISPTFLPANTSTTTMESTTSFENSATMKSWSIVTVTFWIGILHLI